VEFSAAWCAIVLLCGVLSVVLLVGLYRNGRGLRMLVLATAFAWSAIVVLILALTGPGEGWLYVSRHVGPPILIALALAQWPARWDERIGPRGRQGRLTALTALAVVVLGAGSTALGITEFPGDLPGIAGPGTAHFRPVAYALLLAVNLVCVAVGLYGVARRAYPPRSGG
jgi:asparagine N-glycosylation enzyme membrane subunit Stt3